MLYFIYSAVPSQGTVAHHSLLPSFKLLFLAHFVIFRLPIELKRLKSPSPKPLKRFKLRIFLRTTYLLSKYCRHKQAFLINASKFQHFIQQTFHARCHAVSLAGYPLSIEAKAKRVRKRTLFVVTWNIQISTDALQRYGQLRSRRWILQ